MLSHNKDFRGRSFALLHENSLSYSPKLQTVVPVASLAKAKELSKDEMLKSSAQLSPHESLSLAADENPRVHRAIDKWKHRIWRNVLGIEEIEQPVEELEVNFVRYRPETLHQLCKLTKFSKKELQLMYRGFKEGCPTGLVTLEQFKEIYSCFFPQGDSSKYATFIFNTFDRDKNGRITFDEFVLGLSILSRGSDEEKLRWVFNLYDVDNDGYLTRDNIETILGSIYDMMGPNTDPPMEEDTIKSHVDAIFSKMDDNQDGLITLQEFLANCKKDADIRHSLHLFDTVFRATSSSSVPSSVQNKRVIT